MIKNYLDLIEWIRSPRNTKKDYSISLVQSCILQRLIKYSRVNENITYSNEIISEHMFRSKKQIENELPILAKKNLIITNVPKSKDEYGQIKTKRLIKINWDKLNEIKVEMDQYLLSKKKSSEKESNTNNEVTIVESNEKDGSYLKKNTNNVFEKYMGVGSQISLYYLNENGKKDNYTQTLIGKYKKYLDSIGKTFGELTKQDIINMN